MLWTNESTVSGLVWTNERAPPCLVLLEGSLDSLLLSRQLAGPVGLLAEVPLTYLAAAGLHPQVVFQNLTDIFLQLLDSLDLATQGTLDSNL